MSLPANEDTRLDHQGFVYKEKVTQDDHIPWTNGSGVAISQGDFVFATPYFGLADEAFAIAGTGTVHVGQVFGVGSDMVGNEDTFATWGQEVYWDTSEKKFYESEGDGNRYLVGYVREVVDTDGRFAFEGLRFHGAEAST
jgi:hypothetical protein